VRALTSGAIPISRPTPAFVSILRPGHRTPDDIAVDGSVRARVRLMASCDLVVIAYHVCPHRGEDWRYGSDHLRADPEARTSWKPAAMLTERRSLPLMRPGRSAVTHVTDNVAGRSPDRRHSCGCASGGPRDQASSTARAGAGPFDGIHIHGHAVH
jgi:hypothetical protein